jgi:bifunctional enzyme CysN/CysC
MSKKDIRQAQPQTDERLTLVMAGHVDHGKSTVIGRLLADTGALPQGKLEQVKANCARNAKPFEYAFLLDALKDEQSQGITIDAARCFFKTARRHYILMDAPGHVEFLKNMITGAARAHAALLVIDAHEGIQENSKRHGYMVSMLGIRQLVILVNKMDLVDYRQDVFESICEQYTDFLNEIGLQPMQFIPVSGIDGVNIAERSPRTPWYSGPSVLEQIDLFTRPARPVDFPFRMPVQDVYKFTEQGDDRRLVAGTVETGTVKAGDNVIFLPSGKKSQIATVERFSAPDNPVGQAGEALGFTLQAQIYIKPGELMVKADELHPEVGTRFRANVFWMGHAPLIPGKVYKLKLGAARSPVVMVSVLNVLDASELSSIQNKQQVDRHDVAECVFEVPKPVAFDLISKVEQTGRFVIVDDYEIAGAGIVLEKSETGPTTLEMHLREREQRWEQGTVLADDREKAFGHRAKFVLLTGTTDSGDASRAAQLARHLENVLFRQGFTAYYLGLRSLEAGLDADLMRQEHTRWDHIRRLGELARILTESGQIFITSVPDLDEYDLRALELLNKPHEILVIAVGTEAALADLPISLRLSGGQTDGYAVEAVSQLLKDKKVIPEYII